MRISPLKDRFSLSGASFTERYGTEVAVNVYEKKREYDFVRNSVGLTDFSYMQKFRIPEDQGLDFVDSLLAGNVAKVRFGRVLHTFLSDDQGYLLADCYVANNDEELIVVCESIADDQVIRDIFTKDTSASVEDITDSHVVIGIDGYKAWAVVKELFGADILGLPYLSIENYTFEGEAVRLLRAGKTSEFGYLLIAPVKIAEKLFDKLNDLVVKQGGGLCGTEIHNDLRLEGRFFNIFAEGASVKDPLPLGLQWMIDFDKEDFPGYSRISQRRSDGLKKKIIGVQIGSEHKLSPGGIIYNGNQKIAEVQASCHSFLLDAEIGLALFDNDVAYSGLKFNMNSPDGPQISTISMPPIMPKSLTVKLDEI